MREKEEKSSDALKITNQCRVKGGMAYDLKCGGVRLTVLVTPRSNEGDLDEWRVEARASRPAKDDVVEAEWGPTRIAALQAVGRSWTSNLPSHGLAMFDWESVVQVLQGVRAL